MAAAKSKKTDDEQAVSGPFVSAPLVAVNLKDDRVVHLYRGDAVPEEITKESLDNLQSLGFVSDEPQQ